MICPNCNEEMKLTDKDGRQDYVCGRCEYEQKVCKWKTFKSPSITVDLKLFNKQIKKISGCRECDDGLLELLCKISEELKTDDIVLISRHKG